MTRVHMEREFRSGPFPAQEAWPQDVGNGQQLQESGCCTPAARPTMLTPEGAIPPALLEHNLPHQDRLRADGGRSASGPPLLSVPKGSDKPQRQHGSPLPPLRVGTPGSAD